MPAKEPLPAFTRTALLFGTEAMERFTASRVAVAGLGGVGSAVAEMLVRSGIGSIILIDFDTVSESDLNRQLIAVKETIGKSKSAAAEARFLSINPALSITRHNAFCDDSNRDEIFRDCDIIVDAIDSLGPKAGLLEYAVLNHKNIISSMGAGNRTDPAAIALADISEASGCPLLKRVKKYLRKRNITSGIPVVYSTEIPVEPAEKVVNKTFRGRDRGTIGSVAYIPIIMAGWIVSYVLKSLSANPEK